MNRYSAYPLTVLAVALRSLFLMKLLETLLYCRIFGVRTLGNSLCEWTLQTYASTLCPSIERFYNSNNDINKRLEGTC